MPVSFSSAARNLFLLGSSGADVVTNFFKAIDQSSVAEEYLVKGIKYTEYDEQYIIAGKAENSSNVKHGWVSKRQDSGSETWGVTLNAITGQDLILTDIHLDVNGKLIVIGSVETSVTERIPFISRYTGNGVREWQSTSNTANVKYNGVATDADGNCYVCGNTQVSGDAQAFIEKFDADGNPAWGKSAINLQSDVLLSAIDIDTKGYVIAGGYVQDTNNEYKGYFVKLDTETGQVVWDRTLDITDRDWGSIPVVEIKDVKIDGNDFIYIVGTQFAGISGNSAGFICKYNPEGNMLWQRETPIDPPNFGRWRYNCVEVDTDTGQIVILGSYFENTSDEYGVLVKYSDKGDKIFTRVIESTEENPPEFGNLTSLRGGMALDASASFYYVAFTDQDANNVNGTPDKYTYGKVSSSGNGLGDFSYETGDLNTIEYYIQDLGDRIGRLSDGSVRYDTSDLATNILNPTRIMFDDFATPVTNKKRQMNIGGSFAYSGSPAVRPADFQELNLSGDVEIRTEETAGTITSAFWKDQSGKGNDGEVEVTDTLKEPHPGFGSVKFDGSNDYLSMPDTQLLEILDADFTVEFWIYPTGVPQGQFACIFSKGINVQCYFMNTNSISLFLDDNNNGSPYGVFENSNLTGTNSVPLNQWSHVAICRDGSTFKAFVNGVEEYTNSIPGLNPVFNSADDFSIGDYGASPGTYNFQGYISNFRFLKGTALYLADFTVPTTPLTSTGSDTSLLTCQGTGAIVDARTGTPNVITANGGVATSKLETAPSLNAAGYWEFNGTPGVGDGDTINLGDTSTYKWIHDRSVSDWAIEGWFWSNIDEEYAAMISNNSGTSSVGFYMGLRNDELFECVINKGTFGTPACKVLSTDILDQNRWYHIVFVNEDYTIKLYIDGVLQSNAGDQNSFSTGSTANAQTDLRIGKLATSPTWNLNGRIGEIRIYKDRSLGLAQIFQNYNATKTKYTNEVPDIAPKIGTGIVYDSDLLLNYDFGSKATYDDTHNYLLDNFASDTDTGEYLTDDVGRHKIYQADTDVNSAYGVSQTFSSGTYDVSVSMWMKADDIQTNQFALKDSTGSPVGGTHSFTPNVLYPDGGIISHTWSNVTINDSWNFGVYNNNGDARTMLYARPQLTLKSSTGRYVKTYGSVITKPTTIKNLSSSSNNGTLNGGAFVDIANGHLDIDPDRNSGEKLVFDYTWGTFSIEMWIKTRETAQATIATLKAVGQGQSLSDLGMNITRQGNLSNEMRFGFKGGVNFDPGFTFTNNEWEHYVITYNSIADFELASSYTAYKNGSSGTVTDGGTTVLSGQNTENAFIGHDMEIGEFRIYNKVLTAAEVSQNFNATRTRYGV